MKTLGLCLGVACVVLPWMGCTGDGGKLESANEQSVVNLYNEVRSLTDRGHYHAALQLYPAMLEELARRGSDGEGAAGYELERIVYAAARSKDFEQWGKIMDDPEISYEAKEYLALYIHEFSLEAAQEDAAS